MLPKIKLNPPKEETPKVDITPVAKKNPKGLQRSSTFNLDSPSNRNIKTDEIASPSPRQKIISAEDEKKMKEEIHQINKKLEVLEDICSYADKPGGIKGKVNSIFFINFNKYVKTL